MTRRTVVAGLAIVVVALLGTRAAPWQGATGAEASPAARPTVRVARVADAPDDRAVVLHGVTRAADRANLAFAVPGRLSVRHVALGDVVGEGDALAGLDPAPFANRRRSAAAAVDQLEARLAQLTRDRERLEAAGTSVAVNDLDRVRAEEASVEAALAGARAQADEASRQTREAVLRARFDGVVSAVHAEPGEFVGAGQPVLAITGAGGIEVEGQVPESVWIHLQVDDRAEIELPGVGRTVPGTLRSVARAAGPSGLLPVIVGLDHDDGVVAGLTAAVHLRVPVPRGVTVPLSAILDPAGGRPTVYLVRSGRAERQPVVTGPMIDDRVLVTGDLRVDESVVVAGQARLLPGDEVETLP